MKNRAQINTFYRCVFLWWSLIGNLLEFEQRLIICHFVNRYHNWKMLEILRWKYKEQTRNPVVVCMASAKTRQKLKLSNFSYLKRIDKISFFWILILLRILNALSWPFFILTRLSDWVFPGLTVKLKTNT